MIDQNTTDYYRRRSERQALLAEVATTAGVRAIHRELADQYRALADTTGEDVLRPTLRLAL